MFTYVFAIIASAVALAGTYSLVALGVRNGDRPGDARVTAQLRIVAHPEGARPLIVAQVSDPSDTPVLVALRARRALLPAWLAESRGVGVPRRTARRRFQAERYATVGVVPAAGAAEFAVPVPARARRCLLTVAVGQEGGRLRVHWLRLGPVRYPAEGGHELAYFPRNPVNPSASG